ncbi:MAG: hypothetical protein DMG13_15990 [Acidobacteria bacterium]|nr:MAG: hypothetical protein DMG13_15990 [Acidobacteriota bacterium]
MRIQFTKRADGTVIRRCLRPDGSATWERHEKHADFFSFHDLTHYAVETTLGLRIGFYGLIADGWDISDTTGKGKRGKPPPGAVVVEHIVGLLAQERGGLIPTLSAREFNAQLNEMAGSDPDRQPLSEEQLVRVRNRIQELHSQWRKVSPGSTLELTFD